MHSHFFRIIALLLAFSAAVRAAELEKLISLEDPRFDPALASLTVGLDGRVYLTGFAGSPGYVMSLKLDGSDRRDGDTVYALANATANRDGLIATANGHFSHSVNLYSQAFELQASNNDFKNGDDVHDWTAPSRVVAAPSGDFYALDHNRAQIILLDDQARVREVYSYTLPKGVKATALEVDEERKLFYLSDQRSKIWAVNFAGQPGWELAVPAFTPYALDKAGLLCVLSNTANEVKRYRVPNQPAKDPGLEPVEQTPLPLELGEFAISSQHPVRGLAITADHRLVIQRRHPTELFLVADANGKLMDRVSARFRRIQVEHAESPWTSGTALPLALTFTGEGVQAGSELPQWRLWAAPFGDNTWQELAWDGKQLTVPEDAAGLLHLRIQPATAPDVQAQYRLDALVEVRAPAAQGTLSTWTPNNRTGYCRGEPVTASISLRGTQGKSVTARLVLEGPAGLRRELTTLDIKSETPATFILGAERTADLAPGRYRLRALAEGFTAVPQALQIGPSTGEKPAFRTSLGADYTNNNLVNGLWSMADDAEGLADQARALGFNQFFNRIFAGRYPLRFHGEDGQFLEGLKKRLENDAEGVDPKKAEFGFSQFHTLGLYGGAGIREWLILINMDAALPLGASMPWAKGTPIEDYDRQIATYTQGLADLPAFAGWDWVANWWVATDQRFSSDDEKKAYESALKQALESGTWASILDTVGDRVVNWQAEAQEALGQSLKAVAPELTTASAGPYRRPEIYPPTTFGKVDEISLHFQSEQITCPNWTAHAPNFYGLPGKPNWMHPEWFNEDGTGEHYTSLTWLGLMRGVGGIGTHEGFRPFPRPEIDPRIGYHGFPSLLAGVQHWAGRYGDWLLTLKNRDRVAIAVSERQIKIDSFSRSGGVGGLYFSRLFEAYQSFLHTDQPATFLYAEDLEHGGLDGIHALVVVSQEVEPGPKLHRILAAAAKQGIPVYADGTCREGLLTGAKPLGATFNRLDKIHAMNNDMAFFEYPEVFVEQAEALAPMVATLPARVTEHGHPEILVSERGNEDIRAVWVVNNRHANFEPGTLYRVSSAITPRLPAPMDLAIELQPGEALYELTEPHRVAAHPQPGLWRRWTDDAASQPRTERIKETLRGGEARLYVILPESGQDIKLSVSGSLNPGSKIVWRARTPGVKAPLPVRIELRDGMGTLVQARDTVSGSSSLTVPVNAPGPFSLSARNLISGQVTAVGAAPAPVPLAGIGLATPRLRDAAISSDGETLLVNALDWGDNLHLVDLATGEPLRTARVGHYQAFAPLALGKDFLVQGYDLLSGEGYHSYLVDAKGAIQRRFAHPGFPNRMKPWAFPQHLQPPDGGHVAAPDGKWLAITGTLGVTAWSTDGTLLWSQGGPEVPRRRRMPLVLHKQLVVLEGAEIRAYDVDPAAPAKAEPAPVWILSLPAAYPILGHALDQVGERLAVWTAEKGGRIHLIKDGQILDSIPGPVAAAAIAADGKLAVVEASRLHRFSPEGMPVWVADLGRAGFFPTFSPDGQRLVVSTEFGETRVYDVSSGRLVANLGTDSVARPLWLPNGDLLAVECLGRVSRWSPTGELRWTRQLELPPLDTAALTAVKDEGLPTSQWTAWNHSKSTVDQRPNLLPPESTLVWQWDGRRNQALAREPKALFDGDLTPPEEPWLTWETVGLADSGWRGSYALEIDTFRRLLEVDTIAFVEDSGHPASWLRDIRLDVWDPERAAWQFVQNLVSDSAVHSQRLEKPVRGAKFRLSAAQPGRGWPAGNIRLAEIVFQGRDLGSSHPDVVDKKPVAVLFDEQELPQLMGRHGSKPIYARGGAASGGTSLQVTGGKDIYPTYTPHFAHTLADFDFVLAENPQPGEYRWLEFQVKALSPEATAAGLLLSDTGTNGFLLELGKPGSTYDGPHQPFIRVPVAHTVPGEWTTYRVDLWKTMAERQPNWGKDFRLRALRLQAVGGDVAFDRILLARSESDLEKAATNSDD